MKKHDEYQFCMAQFKPAIVGLTVLLVIVLGWTGFHCTRQPHMRDLRMAAAVEPSGPSIRIKDKMLHPYWGNCNKCHITVNAGKPVSQVMAAQPIAIKDKMLHEYWGNCLLCHKVTDGFQAPQRQHARGAGAGAGGGQGPGALAAAFNQFSPQSLGLKLQVVTGALMAELGLANEDGLLVLAVNTGSIADAAGLKKGDEIIRVGKVRLDTLNDFSRALDTAKQGSTVKMTIYRGKKQRNIYLKLKATGSATLLPAAATAPMTQNQIETLAEQLGVPKTSQAVTDALRKQRQGRQVAVTAPMTQNQIETLAEQLGVPKTSQAVTDALRKQRQGRQVAVTAPMTQNQIETLAEQLGVPKTSQAVTDALRKQRQGQQPAQGVASQRVATLNFGKVAVASTGQDILNKLAPQFGKSPYFIVYEPVQQTYSVVTNPNVNDQFGHDIQTGQYMVDLQVSNVIAGSFSQDALNTLHGLRVNVFQGVTGTVQDVLASYLAGNLVGTNTASASTFPAVPAGIPSTRAVNPYSNSTGTPGTGQTRTTIY